MQVIVRCSGEIYVPLQSVLRTVPLGNDSLDCGIRPLMVVSIKPSPVGSWHVSEKKDEERKVENKRHVFSCICFPRYRALLTGLFHAAVKRSGCKNVMFLL